MAKLKVECYLLGMVSTNCYLILNEETKDALIVDPADNRSYVKAKLESFGATPKAILLTHGHFDHIMAVESLKAEYEIPVIVQEAEKEILENPSKNLSGQLGGAALSIQADRFVQDGEVLNYLDTEIKVLHTPGHTVGGACYYFENEGFLISGDTLFRGAVGRTDFPTGDMQTLVQSIQDKLLVLDDHTLVYPGHNESTDIKRERMFNPFLK